MSWDFAASSDGWAQASPVESDAEVQWQPSGTIRGTVRGPAPHLDSPPFRITVNDGYHVVIRMRSFGSGKPWIATEHRNAMRLARHVAQLQQLPSITSYTWGARGTLKPRQVGAHRNSRQYFTRARVKDMLLVSPAGV